MNVTQILVLSASVMSLTTGMTLRPDRDNTLLLNPGKGWVEYGEPNLRYKDVIAVGYTRTSWCNVEPADGTCDWRGFDSFIDTWARQGKKCSISVINFDSWMGKQYTTPKWVFDAGAVPYEVPDGSTPTGTLVLPKTWDDPVYLAKMKAFIAAFGARYDGNPNLAFVDIRNYGNSGEFNGDYHGLKNTSQDSLQNNFIKPYVQAFTNTQLIIPWTAAWFDGKSADPVYAWAVTQGVGIRRDGICSVWSKDASECLLAYGREPAIFEYANGWTETVKEGFASPETLMAYVRVGKPSYIQFQPKFYEANKEFCHILGNKMGYHFILQQAEIPGRIHSGVPFALTLIWLNEGVAPLYESCHVAVALLDRNNNVVQRQWLDGCDPKSWLPEVSSTNRFSVTFTSVPAEGYKFAVGLFLNKSDPKPAYRLGVRGRINTGWYILSGTSDSVAARWTSDAGGSWQADRNWSGCAYRSGVDAALDFSTCDLTRDATLILDSAVTAGSLCFGDATPSHTWTVSQGGGGTLTLRASSGAPAITVKNQAVTLAAPVISYQGLTKRGSGTLLLTHTNVLFGNTLIEGGVLEIAGCTKLYRDWQGATVTVRAGGTLRVNGWSGYGGGWGELDQVPLEDPKTLLLDGGTLEFVGTGAASGSRAFSVGLGGAALKNSSAVSWTLATGGVHAQAVVVNDSSLTLDGSGAKGLMGKSIVGSGSVRKTGAGAWTLAGSNTYQGPTTVEQGTLNVLGSLGAGSAVAVSQQGVLRGTGMISGPLTVRGTLAPGTDVMGSLSVSNTLTLTGTVALRIGTSATGRLNDSVRGMSAVTYGGVLVVNTVGDVPLTAGDAFTLFAAGRYAGAFSSVRLPALAAGLKWSSAGLAVNGTIEVVKETGK
jgi:autotransporter-associated beta strand protein